MHPPPFTPRLSVLYLTYVLATAPCVRADSQNLNLHPAAGAPNAFTDAHINNRHPNPQLKTDKQPTTLVRSVTTNHSAPPSDCASPPNIQFRSTACIRQLACESFVSARYRQNAVSAIWRNLQWSQ